VVVHAGGEGAEAGLQRGDLILTVSGRTPKTAQQFWETVRRTTPGKSVEIEYWRAGKQGQTTVTPRRPEGRPAPGAVPA
jgi:S1-C subfamily serine protease